MSLVLFVLATEYALHCYHVCRVLETLCFAIETAGGVVLSNSAHEVDNAHDVWRSLFPGQSKLPAALIKIPVFSVVTCELRPACSSKTYFIAQYCTGSVNGQGCKGCDLVETFLSFTAAHLLCSGLVAAFFCCLWLQTNLHLSHALSVLSCANVPELSKSSYSSKSKANFINVGFVVVQPLAPQGWQQVLDPPFFSACGLSAPTAKDPRASAFHLL